MPPFKYLEYKHKIPLSEEAKEELIKEIVRCVKSLSLLAFVLFFVVPKVLI